MRREEMKSRIARLDRIAARRRAVQAEEPRPVYRRRVAEEKDEGKKEETGYYGRTDKKDEDEKETPRSATRRPITNRPVATRSANMDRKAMIVKASRSKLATILNTAADALECLEQAEKTEGVTRDTRMARRDLAGLIEKIADFTDKVAPFDPKAVHTLRSIERELGNFPR